MKLTIHIKKGMILSLISLLSLTGAGTVRAESILITDNGSETANTVDSSTSQTSTVNQNNNTAIDNSVQVSSDTGGNSASGNTNGDVSVTSGDTQTDVAISNSANNSTVTTGCCNGGSDNQAVISGNGTGANTTVAANNTAASNVTTTNTTSITNNISGIVNTGNNRANNNTSGNVTVTTGAITVSEQIKNGPINVAQTQSPVGFVNNYAVKIEGNGSYSHNLVSLNLENNTNVRVDNVANILNESLWLLNTGHNDANRNTDGDVTITTGGITFLADILNGPINVSGVEIDCCDEPKAPTGGVEEQPKVPVSQPKDEHKPSESKSSAGNGKGGEVLAAAIGKILPVAGNYTLLYLLIGNVAMFLIGVILRLRSGNSPGTAESLV